MTTERRYAIKLKEGKRNPDPIGTVGTIREAYAFARQYVATHAVEMQDVIQVYDGFDNVVDTIRLWDYC